MKIVHHISVNSNLNIQGELAHFGIVVAETGLVSFDIDESNEKWPLIEEWIARRQAFDFVSTKFSRMEISDSRWLQLVPDWHHGYPQPDDRGYIRATYDIKNWCERCGVGLKQKAPFRMESEPRWGKRSILQLNWVFDEYFVRPDTWSIVLEPLGVKCRPVLNTKGSKLDTVVQLDIRGEINVLTDRLPSEEKSCSDCGQTKYLPVVRGPFPTLMNKPSSAIFRTVEFFGSGAYGCRPVLVSQAVAQVLIANKIRGASFHPVAKSVNG